MLPCLLIHKGTIDLYNFLEILMKVYIKVVEIYSNVEFSGISVNTFIFAMNQFQNSMKSVGTLQRTFGQGPTCPNILCRPS